MPLHRFRRAFSLATTLVLASAGFTANQAARAQDGVETPPFDPAAFAVALEPVADGFERPVHVADPGDGSGRLFVVEQEGRIRILRDGEVLPDPFLDIVDLVNSNGNEQGLLSVAFHPNYAESGLVFVGYTARAATGDSVGDNTIARYRVSADDPNRVDPASGEVLLAISDPYANHNGGLVLFGPDGHLYAGFGDGGSQGDPHRNGQNPDVLLGKILRLDVDTPSADGPYAIPANNPFAAGGGAPEVWAIGLRNPWRFSFDRATGDLYIGDVGGGQYEEINVEPAGATGGANYGWDIMEGPACHQDDECSADGLILPVTAYDHSLGNAVTGGYVYRGAAVPDLRGVYLYADFGSGLLWGLGQDANGEWAGSEPIETDLNISSFGEDAAGELYVTAFDGTLYRVTAPRS